MAPRSDLLDQLQLQVGAGKQFTVTEVLTSPDTAVQAFHHAMHLAGEEEPLSGITTTTAILPHQCMEGMAQVMVLAVEEFISCHPLVCL